ncbi:GNAT family N-acetyltransferase [Bacillus sp. B6(2022)]|nr:GNAT family N-acetyltransferase [Bacillus sp. B6(2022)]
MEIDIWTDEACRGKGLALLAAQQMISICVEKGRHRIGIAMSIMQPRPNWQRS